MEDKKSKSRRNPWKKTSWTYALGNHILEANFPDGSSATFDLTRCVKDMTQTQELGFQYGIKQWMSSNYASCETVEERIESAKADYKGLIEHGLELSEGGKTMGIVGKVRSNAAAGIKMELKEAKNLNVLLMKKVAGKPLTEEEEKWLAEMTEKYA